MIDGEWETDSINNEIKDFLEKKKATEPKEIVIFRMQDIMILYECEDKRFNVFGERLANEAVIDFSKAEDDIIASDEDILSVSKRLIEQNREDVAF